MPRDDEWVTALGFPALCQALQLNLVPIAKLVFDVFYDEPRAA